jgi:CelD/BcsL family acetyltransferase involved in cellulose biosynthesis
VPQARNLTTPLHQPGVRTAVVEIDPVGDPRWDSLVRRHRDAGAYHLGAWAKVMRSAYGHRPRYLGLEAPDGTLLGGLPMMRTRGPMTGRRLRSLPVLPAAGALASSDDEVATLLAAACDRADADRSRVWTLHSRKGELENLAPGLRWVPKPPTYVLALGGDPDEMRRGWKKSASNIFRSVKKAEKEGVTVREAASDRDLRAFYGLYARTMRRRRVLPRPYRQMSAAREFLPEGVFRLFLAEHDGDIVAGALWHSFGSTLDLLYAGSDERRLDPRPNHALYWHAIRWGTEQGHTELDFGHAKPGSGLAQFKESWGAEPIQEYRYDYVPGVPSETADSVEPSSGVSAPARMLEGRESNNLVARTVERLPVRVLAAAGRLAYRL